jgi:hypothetical protein
MKKLLLILSLALMGCESSYVVNKPGATQEQYTQDRNECVYQAELATAPTAGDDPLIANSQAGVLARHCLELRGYEFTKN